MEFKMFAHSPCLGKLDTVSCHSIDMCLQSQSKQSAPLPRCVFRQFKQLNELMDAAHLKNNCYQIKLSQFIIKIKSNFELGT